ncbi:MAG: lipopolysaccharide biosynthesis protein [Clostridia bacterium]|nr:lipopolysaccharide biosynthesis protein [Clostridia bacterium]
MSNNGNKLANSMFWSITERIASQAMGLLVSIILARMILPEAYGIIAAVNIFTSIATTFVSGGFGNALIQKKDADDKDFSSMFIFNTFFSLLMYCLIYFSAPYLVQILNKSYDYELLIKVLRVLGIGIVFSSFNSFYRSLLTKQLLFKKLFIITSIGYIISAAIGITMAYHGFGVWALVSQNLLSYFTNTVFLSISSKWRPKLYFSFSRLKPMLSYGYKLMISGLLITVYSDITSIVIGNKYSNEDLAFYSKGSNFPKLLVLNIITAINTTLFPVMATVDDTESLKTLARRFNRMSAFVITPMMFGFAAVAPAFIKLLLTEKWMESVIFLQVSCFNYAIQPLAMSSLQYLKASGKATEYLVLDIIRKAIAIIMIAIATLSQKGVFFIALSELVANFFAIFVNMYPGKKHLGYKIREQITDVLPHFLLSGVMFIIISAIGKLSIPVAVIFILQIALGIIIYVGCAKLFRFKEYSEAVNYISSLLKNKPLARKERNV